VGYFGQFPTIRYNNYACADLTRRVRLSEQTRNALTLYYNYEVKNGMRADIVAGAYYKDPTLDWLIWLTNDFVDPCYQWNLSVDEFNDYLVKKYGSVENAIRRTVYYRNNWYDDDNVLTPHAYDNELDMNWKKYYAPVYDQNVKILYWKRKEVDWTMETNEIWKGVVSDVVGFNVGDLVTISDMKAEITGIDGSTVYVKNVNYTGDPALYTTITSDTHGSAIDGLDLVYRAIGLDEGVFWSAVTYYDIENERNAYNRSIRILDASHVLPATKAIRDVLKA
jgi:hypothetical protein